MGAVFTVLIVLTCSLVVVRVATVGLTLTGLSKDLAQFQALSAFTGVGFTTRESEEIVSHPIRRRIVMHLMLLGHGGIVIAVASVMLSFLNTSGSGDSWTALWWARLIVLATGIVMLWIAANSRHVERVTWRVNEWAITRFGHIAVHDYMQLLRLSQNFVVWEMTVQADHWLAGHTLAESALASDGILILGIERASGKYLGAPRGQTHIEAGDRLILYGEQEALANLDAHNRCTYTSQIASIDSREKSNSENSSGHFRLNSAA
ncbi:MAG: TrkA C-terminal domain-containing protein [Planctomycetaceae bacterium]|nr:TrkA C-terminal domain-containing protein [Planctomycetaceae bacterium]